MRYLIDSHVHIYPFYRVTDALQAILNNIPLVDDGDVRIACLTERHDCNLFDEIKSGSAKGPAQVFEISTGSETVLRFRHRDSGQEFHLVAGQQVVTAENIEILALNMCNRVPENMDAARTVRSILDNGGLPVVAWAPGKWFLSRGRVVKNLLNDFGPDQIALGDTSLRPREWLTPSIMRAARRRGFRILSGSDPLPFAGEECRPGCYYSSIVTKAAGEEPAALLSGLLENPDAEIAGMGRRPGLVTVFKRMLSHKRAAI